MSAFERALKWHLVSYRTVVVCSRFMEIQAPCGFGAYCAIDSIFFYFGAISIVCLFISYAYPLVRISSLISSLTYLFLRMDPFRFQAGYRKRRLNLALAFLCLFRVVVQRLMNACFCCVRFCFFPYQAKRLAWGNVSRNDLFRIEWYVKPQLNQSINQ